MIRKFKRNALRRQVGNKGLGDAWEALQRRKYKNRYSEVCKRKVTK